ncbi:hypothetical protein DW689_09255 [Ligilactobacillus salivarius]|uniref:hypothetical protein n=1 Tax=Ligilactobacillus salivarius TaxID=1624 RepID=UPI000E4A620A|nr:hypothetical protein [Ligilactobacillus salivarius]RHF32691.1 hypothetical protein DW689_09255 [Ligilactobacillus salivarius]
MGKKLLIGLGVASVAFYASKKLSGKYLEKAASKLDDIVAEGQETALKYREYLLDYLDEDDKLEKLNKKVLQAKDLVDKDSVTEALSNLKSSTSNLKDKLMGKEDSLDNDEDLQDDIVIDQRSAFGKMKEKTELENPTVVFYPDGTSETK